jgi:hypothetical protein
MNQEFFEETLRKVIRRRPSHPFLVGLLDGRIITAEI